MTIGRKVHFVSFIAAVVVALAGCDQRTKTAVDKAGTEIKRETKEAGAEAKRALHDVGETTGQAVEDTAITAKVVAALHAEKNVKSRDIKVETFQGKVLLQGKVPDRTQADLAKKVATSVDGVKAVDNRLTVN